MASPGVFDGWWDWTSFAWDNQEMMAEVRALTLKDMVDLSRDGFSVRLFQTPHDFYVAEALEYVRAWKRSTADKPVMFCGPVGPTEQLALVAEMINSLDIDVRDGYFAAMDEFIGPDGKAIGVDSPLSFRRTDMEMCFDLIRPELRMPPNHLFFPTEDIPTYNRIWEDPNVECEGTQGGQGDTAHIAFVDPVRRTDTFVDRPPTVEEFAAMGTRIVDLHPATVIQDARHSSAGEQWLIPTQAVTVGMKEMLGRSKRISIWQPGHHASPFGIRLTTFMIANRIADARVPMSLLSLHDDVVFSLLAPNIAAAGFEMH
jgi:glucosamine-6-phosphate deaminase